MARLPTERSSSSRECSVSRNRLIVQSFVWNVAQFVAAPIMAIHKYVDEIQVFDGAYQFMGDAGYAKVPWSTDGTGDVLKALMPHLGCPLRWIPCKEFYAHEIAKKLFIQRPEFWKLGEWKYWLADDELPVGDIDQAFERIRSSEFLVGYVRMWEPYLTKSSEIRLKSLGWKARLFKWQEGLHWVDKHYQLYNAQGVRREEWPSVKLSEMSILHLKRMRPRERLLPQLAYERLDL